MKTTLFRGRWTALTVLAFSQLTLAWLSAAIVTVPLLAPLRRHPDGVFALYSDGGRVLAEFASASTSALTLGAGALGLLALLYAALWMALGAVLPVLAVVEPATSLHRAASYSLRRLPTLAGLALVALVGYATAAAAGWFAYKHLEKQAERMFDLRAAQLLEARALVAPLVIVALVTVWHDVARVSAVGTGGGVRASTADAFVTIGRAPLRTLGTALAYALAGALGVVAAYLASRLWGGRDGAAFVALTLAQQLVLLWRFGWRARWILHLGALFRERSVAAAPDDQPPAATGATAATG